MDPAVKLKTIFNARHEEYIKAYKGAFFEKKGEYTTGGSIPPDETIPTTKNFAEWLVKFFKTPWKFDFLPYKLDSVENEEDKGREFIRLLLDEYSDEMEEVQEKVGRSLRRIIKFIQAFSPDLDFLNEIGNDSFVRRPLNRLWQMEPLVIFQDMSVSEDAEGDSLLDTLEKVFTPIVPDVATTADHIRRKWFSWFKTDDERDEMIFYETVERSLTHAVATESRIAQTDWIFRNLDGNSILIGILDVSRKGLECLTMFCGNYKFISENRFFLKHLLGAGI